MPPNPNVLQLKVGLLVTLVLVRDTEEQEYKIVIAEHGRVSRRTEIPIPGDVAARAAKFLAVPFHSDRSVVTDEPLYNPRRDERIQEVGVGENTDEDITKPEKIGTKPKSR